MSPTGMALPGFVTVAVVFFGLGDGSRRAGRPTGSPGRRCCSNRHTCLCELNSTFDADLARAVRALPERCDPDGR